VLVAVCPSMTPLIVADTEQMMTKNMKFTMTLKFVSFAIFDCLEGVCPPFK
jgi:hypothetical protein